MSDTPILFFSPAVAKSAKVDNGFQHGGINHAS